MDSSITIGGMNVRLFNDFLAQTRQNLNPDDLVILIYDGSPAHRSANNPGGKYSPFLNIVEQAISALKAAIKADISQPAIQEEINNREEARR